MMTYSHGSIVAVNFQYTSGSPGKRRPALVIFDSGDADLVVARLTTQSRPSAHDVAVADWAAAGLHAPSVARLDKLLTTEKVFVGATMGCLSAADHQAVSVVLHRMFGNW